jgi:hypothetical protein
LLQTNHNSKTIAWIPSSNSWQYLRMQILFIRKGRICSLQNLVPYHTDFATTVNILVACHSTELALHKKLHIHQRTPQTWSRPTHLTKPVHIYHRIKHSHATHSTSPEHHRIVAAVSPGPLGGIPRTAACHYLCTFHATG